MLKKAATFNASVALLLGVSVGSVHSATYVTNIDEATYGKIGTITLDDWGYVGENGRTAADFEPINGFNFDSIGQIQHVVTRDADLLTPDDPTTTLIDLYGGGGYRLGNMDATVTFFDWAYTTKGGSTFTNMLIDTDGDYFVSQEDMNFIQYDTYVHTNTTAEPGQRFYAPDGTYYTNIAFKPYVLSNAKGWCGSIKATNPGAIEPIAGQLTFDFAFDVYFQSSPGVFQYSSTEIVKDFEMRSFGTLSINVTNPNGSGAQVMTANAVVNNTNPTIGNLQVDGAPVDPNFYNIVSFMGGGVLEQTVGRCGILNPDFVGGAGLTDINTPKYLGLIDGVPDEAACTTAGGTWQTHAYGGYAYILRADGIRVIEAMDYAAYPDLSNVPTVVGGTAYNNDENGVSLPVADITGTPNAFAFTDAQGVAPNTLVTSDALSITGLARETVITIDGGEYSINASPFTSTRGVITNNDSVSVRTTSSSNPNTTVNAVLTIGSLNDTFSVSTTDSDNDGVYDAVDNCPVTPNADQSDTGGIDTTVADGIGDACQCGDVNGDGTVTNTDANLIRLSQFGWTLPAYDSSFCDVNGDGNCTNTDAVVIQRTLLDLPPGITQACPAASN